MFQPADNALAAKDAQAITDKDEIVRLLKNDVLSDDVCNNCVDALAPLSQLIKQHSSDHKGAAAAAAEETSDDGKQAGGEPQEAGSGDAEKADKTAAETAKMETFWEEFQKMFGFAEEGGKVPMNAANLCPEPRPLLALANILRFAYNDNVALQMRTCTDKGCGRRVLQLREARRLIARGVGLVEEDAVNDIALLRNSSEGNNIIANGYNGWPPVEEDNVHANVVIWEQNHPTNKAAWYLRQGSPKRFEIRTVTVPPPSGESAERYALKVAHLFKSQLDQNTRFLSYTEISNGSGQRIPDEAIKDIWDYVDKRNKNKADRFFCHIHIDGTMAWGAREVDLAEPHCHSFVSSAHKWFLGPKETALFYMCPEQAEKFTPPIFAYDYKIKVPKISELPKNALRFELIGQRDDVNLITLAFTQNMWCSLSKYQPYQRVQNLAAFLKAKLALTGWTLVTPAAPFASWGVVRVQVPGNGSAADEEAAEKLYTHMYDSVNIAGAWGEDGTFRLCPHIYNTMENVRDAVKGMNDWKKQQAQ